MVVHFTSAAHYVADVVLLTVAGTARCGVFFDNVDVLTLHLTVTHKVARSSKRGKSGAYEVRGFVVHSFGFARSCKCFIVAA